MRIFDDPNSSPRQGDNLNVADRGGNTNNNSGSESGSTSSDGGERSGWSDSTSLSASSANPRRNRARTKKRIQNTYNKLTGSNSVPIPNGVILTNGGGRGHERLINGLLPSRSASASPRTGLGKRHHKDGKILRRGKKFPPPTPTPTISNYTKNNINEDDGDLSASPRSKSKGERQRDRSTSRILTLEDMELVDYDDLGSSSSSLASHYGKKNDNFQSRTPQPSKNTVSKELSNKNSSKTDFTKLNDGARKDSDISNTLSIIDNDFNENVPCSSSSLRERLSSQRSHRVANTSSKASIDMNTVYEDTFIVDHKSENEKRGSSLSKSESHSRLEVDDKNLLSSEKYNSSGVGRHFGKKRSNSNVSLGGGDGESLIGLDTGDSLSAELLGYLMRLKAVAIVFLGTVFVLSVSSLLFVFPIVVDPILLGLEAEFSLFPVNCRTTNLRSGKGSVECSFPSCRAGCTADLFVCTFVDVEYSYYVDADLTLITSTLPPMLIPQSSEANISSNRQYNFSESKEQSNLNPINPNSTTLITKQGTLFININGCGYPPSVNCTEFIHQYGAIGKEFGCYYSANNASIVVPYYNYDEEKHYLFIAILIPCAIAVFAALALFLLIKPPNCWRSGNRGLIVSKSPSELKLLDKALSGSGLSLRSGSGSGGVTGRSARDVSKKWKKRNELDKDNGINNKNNGVKMNGVDGYRSHHEEFTIGDGPYMNGSLPKSNGHAFQQTIGGLMGMVPPDEIHKSIKTLPHQHVSLENEYLNGSPQHQLRRPLYTKKNDVSKGPASGSRPLTQTPISGESPLFVSRTSSTKEQGHHPSDDKKLAEHKL